MRNFEEWINQFKFSISGYDYYVDFKKVYTGNDNGISCNVYAVKENNNIVLLGAGRKEDAIVRIYLHLIWQEDSKTWIPLYYES